MYRLALVAAALAFVNSASVSLVEPRIIGGNDTSIEKAPFQVSVQLGGRHICGGIIVSATKILTTANCIVESRKSTSPIRYKIRVGSNKYDEGGELIDSFKIFPHPKHTSGFGYNAALITLVRPVKFGRNAKMVILASKQPDVGDIVTVTGWGDTKYKPPTKALQLIQVPVIDKNACANKVERYMRVELPSTMFCAGSNDKTIYTMGDAGGPVTNSQNELVGISVYSPAIRPYNFPGIYTNINDPIIREFIDARV